MSIKLILPLLSLFVIAPTVSAEEFHHKFAQLSYSKGNWMFDSEHAFNEHVYMTGFIDRSDDISESKDLKIRAVTFGAGLFGTRKISNNLQVYGGLDIADNIIRTTVKNKSTNENNFISYRPKVGISFARKGGLEFDFNAAYNIADFDYIVDDKEAVYNSPIFAFALRYHIIPALTVSTTYSVSFSEDDIFDYSNVILSVRLNFQ